MTKNTKRINFSVQYKGEHHMGAASIDIVLVNAFKGVSHFRTTNGGAISDSTGRFVVIFDSTMFLVLDSLDSSVHHCATGLDFEVPKMEIGKLLKITHTSGNPNQHLTLDLESKRGLQKGFGRVSNGKFPSAYP
jgi:hypothetical protein